MTYSLNRTVAIGQNQQWAESRKCLFLSLITDKYDRWLSWELLKRLRSLTERLFAVGRCLSYQMRWLVMLFTCCFVFVFCSCILLVIQPRVPCILWHLIHCSCLLASTWVFIFSTSTETNADSSELHSICYRCLGMLTKVNVYCLSHIAALTVILSTAYSYTGLKLWTCRVLYKHSLITASVVGYIVRLFILTIGLVELRCRVGLNAMLL
jgi:hypothetical protein